MAKTYIGFTRAYNLVCEKIAPLPSERRPLADCLDAVAAEDFYALVDVPSAATSLKDGYAVRAVDIAQASSDAPVRLPIVGLSAAGAFEQARVEPHTAMRILTGGRIPLNADAVVAEEFTHLLTDDTIAIEIETGAGRNILPKGADVNVGEKVVTAGEALTPGRLGLLAAAGKSDLQVFKKPRLAIVATGDEIVLPGTPLKAGQLYASNAVTLEAWCRRLGCETDLSIVPDQSDALVAALRDALGASDAVLTSGGAWSGERDLVSKSLDELGWQKIFHRVRLGPGKATGMGRVGQTPVFILPGGPPSNLIGFLKLALPGLLKLGGNSLPALPQRSVLLAESVQGPPDWTQAVFGRLRSDREGRWNFQTDRQTSRLKAMGHAEALLTIPEGVERFSAGTHATVDLLM